MFRLAFLKFPQRKHFCSPLKLVSLVTQEPCKSRKIKRKKKMPQDTNTQSACLNLPSSVDTAAPHSNFNSALVRLPAFLDCFSMEQMCPQRTGFVSESQTAQGLKGPLEAIWRGQIWAQYSKSTLTNAEQRIITFLDLVVILCLMQPRIPLGSWQQVYMCWISKTPSSMAE